MARTVDVRNAQDPKSTFWDAKPALKEVRHAAEIRHVGKWALLAACLARTATRVPVGTVLPATIGSYASLNYFVAIAAGSSGGKSTTQALARELVPLDGIPTMPLGTGQGITGQYVTNIAQKAGNKAEGIPPTPAHLERTNTAVFFSVDEIKDIAAKASSGSNNLMAVLRSSWGAENQGSGTVSKDNNLRLEAHTYRMGLVINTQLGAARFLLDDHDTGTPQRFLFVPAIDNSGLTREEIMAMTREERRPSDEAFEPISLDHIPFEVLGPLDLETPTWFHRLNVCEEAEDAVTFDRNLVEAGLAPDYPPHHLLNRLKTAALMSFLCGGNGDVTGEYWELAGTLMEVSEETKSMLIEHAERAAAEEDAEKGRHLAAVDMGKDAAKSDIREKQTARARALVQKYLANGPMTLGAIRKKLDSTLRGFAADALTTLAEEGIVINVTDDLFELSEGA